MPTKKFGLREYETLAGETKLKKGTMATVDLILKVVGIPNTVVPEAEGLVQAHTDTANKEIARVHDLSGQLSVAQSERDYQIKQAEYYNSIVKKLS